MLKYNPFLLAASCSKYDRVIDAVNLACSTPASDIVAARRTSPAVHSFERGMLLVDYI
jgi:hypothetical protein